MVVVEEVRLEEAVAEAAVVEVEVAFKGKVFLLNVYFLLLLIIIIFKVEGVCEFSHACGQ